MANPHGKKSEEFARESERRTSLAQSSTECTDAHTETKTGGRDGHSAPMLTAGACVEDDERGTRSGTVEDPARTGGVNSDYDIVVDCCTTVNGVRRSDQLSARTASVAEQVDPAVAGDLLLDDLHTQGWAAIPPNLPGTSWFKQTYLALDEVLDQLQADPQAADALNTISAAWLSDPARAAQWCGTRPGFKDRTAQEERPDKTYIQALPAFAPFLRTSPQADYLSTRVPALGELLTRLEYLSLEVTTIFTELVAQLEEHVPFRAVTEIDSPTIVVKGRPVPAVDARSGAR